MRSGKKGKPPINRHKNFEGTYKFACVSRITYPDPLAHALHTAKTAAALAQQTGEAHIFVRGLTTSVEQMRSHYGLDESPLLIWSLHSECLPRLLRGYYGHPLVFNSIVAGILGFHPAWQRTGSCRKTLFVNTKRDYPFWGLLRSALWWFKDWLFVGEVHDIAGIDLENGQIPGIMNDQNLSTKFSAQQRIKALQNYDLVLCVTQALASDLERWSNHRIKPHIVRNASGLPRLSYSPERKPIGDQITLGYIGTIDRYRGVDKLLMAMRLLPDRYHLRLVGRIPGQPENGRNPDWLAYLMEDPAIRCKVELVPPVLACQVAEEIDRCDIVLQPASNHIFTLHYAAPLKSFDYMVRGKPIIAADVPCHRELFQDGINAIFYKLDDVENLASKIKSLVEQPWLMDSIGKGAWEQSAEYTYPARAQRILELVDEAWEWRHAKRAT